MPSPLRSADLDVGTDLLSTSLDASTGTILVQTGDVISGDSEADEVEYWQQAGFASRPAKATAGSAACQGVVYRRGDRNVCVATRDVRAGQVYGALSDGETCMYGPGADGKSQGRVAIKDDGSVTLYTTSDNTDAGKAVYLRIEPTALTFVSPWGSLKWDNSGFTLQDQSGALIAGGKMPTPLPPPLDAIQSFIRIEGGVAEVRGSTVKLGVGASFVNVAVNPALAPTLCAGSTTILVSE